MAARGAPKAATPPQKSRMAVVAGHEVVSLDAVSLADDSGWHDLDPARVEELSAMIFGGNLGATALAGPSLIQQNGT